MLEQATRVKHKIASLPEWPWVTAKRFVGAAVDEADFRGYVALLAFDALGRQGWLPYADQRLLIADVGYSWLQYYPAGARHTLTATYDQDDRFVYWYIDIVRAHGLGDDGIPWYDDLYLDIIILRDGAIHLLDAEELDAALAAGAITPGEWQLAWDEADRLLAELARGPLPAMGHGERHLRLLRALPMLTIARDDTGR